jgi:uncharacterized repeat protein (TIGR02543 family)
MFVQTTGIEPQMRRTAILITTFALAMAGLVFSPANAATVSCSGSGSVDITDNVVTFGRDCAGAVVIPAGVTSIGDSAFSGASSLTSITIPASVITIEDWAFRNTSSLASVTFEPNSQLTSIGNYAFRSVNGNVLTSFTIPARVTSIGEEAFRAQNALTSVTIPASVTSIGRDAFWSTQSLTSVYFLGNAPANIGTTPFLSVASGAKAYINSGATGFGSAGDGWNGLIVEVGVYTVSYNTNGGSNISAQGFRGNIAEPSVPTRTGYTFAGWSATDGGSVLTFPYTPTSNSDFTLFANWTALALTDLAKLTFSAKKKYAIKPLAQKVGVTIVSSKATVSFKVAKSSSKICTKSGSKLKTLKAGNCIVTFTVQEPKPKKGKKPKATRTIKTLVVQ